jgi:hypothetical protein
VRESENGERFDFRVERVAWSGGIAHDGEAMRRYDFDISVKVRHRVVFGRDVFGAGAACLAELLREGGGRRVLALVEEGVDRASAGLGGRIEACIGAMEFDFRGVRILPGGEAAKGGDALVRRGWGGIDAAGIGRHSYVVGGGGAWGGVGGRGGTLFWWVGLGGRSARGGSIVIRMCGRWGAGLFWTRSGLRRPLRTGGCGWCDSRRPRWRRTTAEWG